jgi:Holliday junction resolvasome RuvABC endonuclease subunit
MRAMSICIPMMEQLLAWIDEYDIEHLEVCVESPFYNNNSVTLMKQMALFVLVQVYVYDYLVPLLSSVHLTIVHNATSKSKLAHNGSASKAQMIAASPWSNFKKCKGMSLNQAETCADAYAHSLSGGIEMYDLSNMAQYMVEANYEE